MKSSTTEYGVPLPQEERQVWDQFCDDHELLERLQVTPQELTALKNCVLLGTLTCKGDMLFILRQIRMATEPSSEDTTISPAPEPSRDIRVEDPAKVIGAPANYRPAASVSSTPEPGSLAAIAGSRSRVIKQFGLLCWTLVLLGFVLWNAVTGLSNWQRALLTTIGVQTQQATPDKR
jgi:hypothetical protein